MVNSSRPRAPTLLWPRFALLVLAAAGQAWPQASGDTIGFTSRDLQMTGPALRYLVNDPARGIHAVWKDDYSVIRYNFRPRSGSWRWPGGVAVNLLPSNLGCVEVDITTGRALISADYLWKGNPVATCFEDSGCGSGAFTAADINTGFRHILVGASQYGWPKFSGVNRDTLCHLSWLSRLRLGRLGPMPTHNLAVSKQSGRFGHTWSATDGPDRGALFLKQTPNNGANWYETVALSESVPSHLCYSRQGGCATYDSIRIHLVAAFDDGLDPGRSEIWHYCPYETPAWSMVHEYAGIDSIHLDGSALAAGRPSIGIDRRRGECYAAWEQFDPANTDPLTGLCRADIWASRSIDNGRIWGTPVRLTRPNAASKRFPFLAEVADDTLRILYFADAVAGFWEHGQGPRTDNPVICLSVPATFLPTSVSESEGALRPSSERDPAGGACPLEVLPTVSSAGFIIRVRPGAGVRRVSVFSASGQTLADFSNPRSSTTWGTAAPPGVYLIRAAGHRATTTYRVVKAR